MIDISVFLFMVLEEGLTIGVLCFSYYVDVTKSGRKEGTSS